MVLQFVEKHGRITRSEAAGLCQVGSNQAYRILKKLTNNGLLAKRGDKKGAYYERSG
jgi:ATP-dependent DNA helicase RecG